jgi:hypothetical protein
MAEIIPFFAKNAAEDPDNVLEQAKGRYASVLILGWTKDEDTLEARCSTNLTYEKLLYLSSQFNHNLLSGNYFTDREEE